MSMPSYIDATPDTGSGNHNSSIGCDENTGRNSRSGTMIVRTQSQSKSISIAIQQQGAASNVDFEDSQYNVGNSGGTVTVKVITNVASLTVELLNISDPATIQSITKGGQSGTIAANGKSASIAPSGDPGQNAEYEVNIVFSVSANSSSSPLDINLKAKDSNNNSIYDTAKIVLAAGDETLEVYNSGHTATIRQLDFPASGGTQTIVVDSNTNWEIV